MGETFNSVGVLPGKNMLPSSPQWGVHRIVSEADDEDPVNLSQGVNASTWEEVWLEVAFEDAYTGTTLDPKTATIEIWFWSPAVTIVEEEDGSYSYTGGWVKQDVLEDVDVIDDDDGHRMVLLSVGQRSFFLKVTDLGGSPVHLLVSGAKRVS